MELREYLRLLSRERALIIGIIAGALALGALLYRFQPQELEATLLLNIGRSGQAPAASNPEYTYDSFYRLQADGRFGDTVVRWLEDPRVVTDIVEAAGVNAGTGGFDAARLSSQVVTVRYRGSDPQALRDLSHAAVDVLNGYTARLNESQEPHWFVLLGNDPVIDDARFPLWKIEVAALFFGTAASLFLVLFRYYLNSPPSHADRR